MAVKDRVAKVERAFGEDMTLQRAIASYVVLFAYFTFLLFPIVWLIGATFKTSDALLSQDVSLLPGPSSFTLNNYVQILSNEVFRQFFINSTVIAVATTVLALFCALFAGYGVSRFDFPGRNWIIIGFLSTQMLPRVLIIIPFFLTMTIYGLVDTYVGIVLAHSVSAIPLATWLLKGYIDDISPSLDEAARMDGCSTRHVLWYVILPLSIPGITVAGFYTFIVSWSEYLFVSILSRSMGTRTLPFGLQLFQSSNQVNWGAVLTASVVTMIPVLVLFALVQRYIVAGLSSGGMKGTL